MQRNFHLHPHSFETLRSFRSRCCFCWHQTCYQQLWRCDHRHLVPPIQSGPPITYSVKCLDVLMKQGMVENFAREPFVQKCSNRSCLEYYIYVSTTMKKKTTWFVWNTDPKTINNLVHLTEAQTLKIILKRIQSTISSLLVMPRIKMLAVF